MCASLNATGGRMSFACSHGHSTCRLIRHLLARCACETAAFEGSLPVACRRHKQNTPSRSPSWTRQTGQRWRPLLKKPRARLNSCPRSAGRRFD